jgi:hypothetical protein
MPAPLVQRHLIRKLWRQGRPFRVHGICRRGGSNKWWELSYDGTPGGKILCNHGKIGSHGRKVPFEYGVAKAIDKADDKLLGEYSHHPDTLQGEPPMPVKLEGPYADIARIIKRDDDHFEAFDGTGHPVVDLTAEGVLIVMASDPSIPVSGSVRV